MTEIRGERVLLRPVGEDDVPELRRIHAIPEVARWWGDPEDGFPFSDAPETTRFTIEVGGAVAGLVQYEEETDPRYRSAWIDIYMDPALGGKGLGTEALRALIRHLVDARGHHHLLIDPAAANARAIRSYEKAGFKPVGIMRRHERDAFGDEWHDSLLMDLVAEDLG